MNSCLLTVKTMHLFSLIAPQQPKNETMNIIDPEAINNDEAEK